MLNYIGGAPLGMAFDKDDNLHVCVGGMGVYRITPDRKVELVTDETNRSIYSVNDDSRMRLADDLDIAPDGKIWFSEATVRYEIHDWPIDALEARGNGRIICHDPKTGKTRTMIRGLIFPNGVCIGNDQQSIIFSETWGCTVKRYYFDGPKKGKIEVIAGINLPMLIRLAKARGCMTLEKAVIAGRDAGRNYITIASEFLGQDA